MATTDNWSLIRDQREMVGGRHETVEEIEAAWQRWANTHGLAYRRSLGDLSLDLRESDQTVRAYVSGGNWVADCPECNGGIACWRGNPRGACLDCGTIYPVEHPAEEDAARAVELLAARPDPTTRSWHVHLGETVDDLAAENDAYLAVDAPTGGVVSIDDVARSLGAAAVAKLRTDGVLS